LRPPVEILRQRVWLLAVIKTKSSLTSNDCLPARRGAGMPRSQFGGFRVMMISLQRGLGEIAVGRRFASAMILVAALVPPAVHAQVNIDQGKAPAQIYDSDCAACHKSMRGLANGRGASALTSFLTEHYTSSSKEAAALAAYVLAGGGAIGTPAPVHAPKMKPEPTTASAEEPKDREMKRPAKPEGDQTPAPKPQRPSTTNQKPEGATQKPDGTQGAGTAGAGTAGAGTAGAGTRVRGQPKPVVEPPAAAPKPTAVVVAPSAPQASTLVTSPGSSEPSEAQPSADAPVPRDNIPD
jgi:hypothetical protein